MSFFGKLIPGWVPLAVIAFLCVLILGQRVQVSNAKANVARSQKDLSDYKLAVSETTRKLQADTDRKRAEQLTREREAADAAKIREAALRADADGAVRELDRLRLAIRAAARRDPMPKSIATADPEPTASISDLLLDCAENYQSLAEVADRHSSDVRTLIDSWPKR